MRNIDFARQRLQSPAKFRANSLTPSILAMLTEGHQPKDIAAKLGCSVPHVTNVGKRCRYGSRKFTVEGLSDEDCVAIYHQAEKIGCSSAELARAYIIDGIAENKESES